MRAQSPQNLLTTMSPAPPPASIGNLINQLIFIGYNNAADEPVTEIQTAPERMKKVYISATEESIVSLIRIIDPVDIAGTTIIVNPRSVDTEDAGNLLYLLKGSSTLNMVPVVVIADRMFMRKGEHYLRCGADEFYSSPVSWNDLKIRLSFLTRYKHAFSQASLGLDTNYLNSNYIKAPRWKRALDILIGSTGIIALLPVMLLTALAIRWESKGPVIYKSKRIGAGFREFSFWKFRSMYADADARLAQMQQNNQYGSSAAFVKIVNDPRITRVGRFIRKYSLDELPQLYNILKGDMSVVGNRPLPVYEAEQLIKYDAAARFLTPAGLTGLWQVNKRGQGEMDEQERIALDVQYSDESTLWLDMKIIAKTFTAFVQKENV